MRAALLCAILAACGGRAPAPAAREAPPPRSKIPELDYFVGAWTIQARNPATGQRFTMRYLIEPALGGAWLSGHGTSRELGVEVRDYWGRDPAGGGLVRIILQSDGTAGTVRSSGWQGEVLVLEGEVKSGGAVVQVRETITRRGPARFDAVWEQKGPTGWSAYSVEQITRQQGPRL
ncbi:MAG TPA: hypothetical protein VFU21_25440 [Kofleriaceae bacterium]|nr:hypothetical protein [Kofleriaceae bacterium]